MPSAQANTRHRNCQGYVGSLPRDASPVYQLAKQAERARFLSHRLISTGLSALVYQHSFIKTRLSKLVYSESVAPLNGAYSSKR